jgi:hypothetical protein
MGGRKGHQNKQNKRPHSPDGDDVTANIPPSTTTEPTITTTIDSPTTSTAPFPARQKGPEKKRQKREEYRTNLHGSELPQKKYYRQRAHANPFSDHALT